MLFLMAKLTILTVGELKWECTIHCTITKVGYARLAENKNLVYK